jgi:hypothetical protein
VALFQGEDVEGDHEDGAKELLWPTAKQPRGGHGEGGTISPQDIAPDFEHADRFPHGYIRVHAPNLQNKSNNQRQFLFDPE